MTMATPHVRVLIVDDEPLARERLRMLLQDEHGVDSDVACAGYRPRPQTAQSPNH